MRPGGVALALCALISCKQPPAAPPAGSAGAASTAIAPTAGSAAPVAGLAFDQAAADEPPEPPAIAFAGKVPRLPAVSADGSQLAVYGYPGSGPMMPAPIDIELHQVDSDAILETLPLFDDPEATAAEHSGSDWRTPALRKVLAERGAAALARLRGFHSLEPVTMALESGGRATPTKVGALVLDPGGEDAGVVELRDARGGVLQRVELAPYSTGSGDQACSYRPWFREAARDPAANMLYVQLDYRYRDGCDPATLHVYAWSLDPAKAAPEAAIHAIVTRQFDVVGVNETEAADLMLPAAPILSNGMTVGSTDGVHALGVAARAMDYSGATPSAVQVTVARDGKSAWASELASIGLLEPNTPGRDVAWRASDVLVKTAQGWRIAALDWTEPRANAAVNRDAKAGKLSARSLGEDRGDDSLCDAFARLTTAGVDAAAAARADLVAIGSGPGERTVGGAGFARAWNAAWKGKVTVASVFGRALPSGTTGWVGASIELAKPGYKVAFTVFAVFDRTADGTWSLVHIHFAA
jgi:ketosteroid isomerase-like protein